MGAAPRTGLAPAWRALRIVAPLLGAAALVACGTAPPPSTPGTVVLGTVDLRRNGDGRWVDIVDGQDAELAPGAQGGFHVWLRYRTQHLQGRVRVRRIAERTAMGRTDRVLTADGVVTIEATGADLDWATPDPIPNFMCPTPIGVSVIDQPIDMTLKLEDADSAAPLAEGRARVTARCPPEGDPQRAFCLQICSG